MNFWTTTQCFPPLIVRLLAKQEGSKHHPVPMTEVEIAQRSGLSLLKVACISEMLSWDECTLQEMRQFTRGCGIDFGNVEQMKRLRAYLTDRRHKKFTYLKRSKQWSALKPLILRWQEALREP